MKFITIRDLRSKTAQIRKDLQTERDIVVTANGRPFALMSHVGPDDVEEGLLAVRAARARTALDRMRAGAKASGMDRLTMDEIDAIIAEVRRERRGKK